MGRSRRIGMLLTAACLILSAGLASAQWPGLPERPALPAGQDPRGVRRPEPFPRATGQPPRSGPFGAVPQVPLPGEGPQGTAPRTGSGLGLWEALTAMAQEDPESERPPGALESRPDRALMLRYTDEVALRAPGERGWDVLPWWRKVHTLSAGHSLRLKGRGRALLAFHDGAAIELNGGACLEILSMDRDAVLLRLEELKTLTLDARERPFRMELPGGYALAAGGGLVQVHREGARRFRVENLGPTPSVVEDGSRQLPLEWNQGCTLPWFQGNPPVPLRPPGAGEPRRLAQGLWLLAWQGPVRPEPVVGGWRLEAGPEAGWLQWGQAAFDVPSGARLRLVGPATPGSAGGAGAADGERGDR